MESKVIILDQNDYDEERLAETIERGMALLGGWDKYVHPGMTVLLKPNLIGPEAPELAATTHPALIRLLCRKLKGLGCTVWVGDSAGGAIGGITQTAKSLEVSGIADAALDEGAIIKDFDKEGVTEFTTAGGEKMYIARPAMEADLVINLPKLKTHILAGFTGAVKNLFGCIPGLKKGAYHAQAPTAAGLGAVLADINEAVRPGLHIMDGITAMQGNGPTGGTVYPAKVLMFATDALAMDATAMRMVGLDIEKTPFYRPAIERRLGQWRTERITIAGDHDCPPRLKGFKLTQNRGREMVGAGALTYLVSFLKTVPEVDLKTCTGCNACSDSCPVAAIDRETKKIDYGKCIECMCCHEMCIYKSVRLKRKNPLARALMGNR
jgi:uncharacterized protein (DUF362 family)/NAD-dependent dihydropyrimidine dehydrogenase PreA subunit